MKYGTVLGLIFLPMGLICSYFGYTQLESTGMTIKILAAGPVLSCMGLAMLIFPGGDTRMAEISAKTKTNKDFWKAAPIGHRLAWIVFSIPGFVVIFYYLLG